MTRTDPYPGRRAAAHCWLAVFILPLLVAVGCGGDDDAPPPAAPTSSPSRTSTPTAVPSPTPTMPNASASAACQKLEGCDQCFINSTGQCINTSDCAARLGADAAICINGATGCDPNGLGDCLFLGCDGNDPTGECE